MRLKSRCQLADHLESLGRENKICFWDHSGCWEIGAIIPRFIEKETDAHEVYTFPRTTLVERMQSAWVCQTQKAGTFSFLAAARMVLMGSEK